MVAAEVRDAPRVVRDPRAGGVGVGGELRVVHRGGRAAAAEDLRGAHLRVRRHAEAVLVALGVLPGRCPRPAAIEVDVRPVPAAVGGVRVGGEVVGVVDSTEQVRVDGGRVSAIETRVRHVDGEAEGGSESLRRQPRVVPRTARRVAGEVPGHDLGGPLVVQLRHARGLDRHHRRVGGELGHLGCAQVEELGAHVHGGQAGAERPARRRPPRRGRPRRALRPPSARPRGRSPPRARPCRPSAGRWRHVPRGMTPRARSRGRERLPPRARCSRSGRRSPARWLRWPAASRATRP